MTHAPLPTGQDDSHDRHHRTDRALVLGGGGSVGNAWLIGVTAALCEAGIDVSTADLVVGTSAGATAAAQLAGATPPELLAEILAAPPHLQAASACGGRHQARTTSARTPLQETTDIISSAADPADMRRRLGAWALARADVSGGAVQARWRDTVAARLPRHDWPDGRLLITAVDAETGEPVAFDRHSGVDLVDAVAASCSSASAYGIGDRHYIDGGYRSNADNADLAAGCRRVLVLSPFGGRSRTPAKWGLHLATQVEALRTAGSTVETVFPDSGALAAFGDNAMDVSRRPAAARAGYEQGRAAAAHLERFWR